MTVNRLKWAAAGVVVLCFGVILFYPLGNLAVAAVSVGETSFSGRLTLLRQIVTFTYAQALMSAVASSLFGLFAAVLYSDQEFLGRRLIWRLSLVSFSLPPILTVLAYFDFWHGQLLGWPAIIFAHTFYNYPIVFKAVGSQLTTIDRTEERVALSLGLSRAKCFWQITLPKISPSLRGSFCLAFLYSATSFLVVMMLGGGPRFSTIEVAIYQATRIDLDLTLAGLLAGIQLIVSVVIYCFAGRNPSVIGRSSDSPYFPIYRARRAPVRSLSVFVFHFLLALLVLGPLGTLVGNAVREVGSLSTAELLVPLRDSLRLGILVALLTIGLAFSAAYVHRHSGRGRAVWDLMMNVPIAVSSLIFSLGILLTYRDFLDWEFGVFVFIVGIQSLSALPLVYRLLRDRLGELDEIHYRVAASLGAAPGQRLWRLEIPTIGKAFVVGAGFALAISLGEVGAVMMLARQELVTLPVEIYRLMAQYRFPEAHAVGAILIGVMGLTFFIVGKQET